MKEISAALIFSSAENVQLIVILYIRLFADEGSDMHFILSCESPLLFIAVLFNPSYLRNQELANMCSAF